MAAINIGTYAKAPGEKRDFSLDWSEELEGDTISTSIWPAVTGITQSSPSNDASTTTTWIEGGTAGTDYLIVNRITTAGGRILEASFTVAVRNS